jgi:hypothetical protein
MNWEELRTNWVNGNRTDCLNFLRRAPKSRLWPILAEALNTAHYLDDNPQGTHSGDIADLREMLNWLADS